MKNLILSYSFTGNNEALANSIATKLAIKHIRISEPKRRTTGTIILDTLLNRTPKVNPSVDKIDNYDLVIFVGPVWLGQAATPFRLYFKHLKNNSRKYAFISINGGALNPNPKLAGELKKRVGRPPVSFINLHIADLLPPNPKPQTKDTQSYHLTNKDVDNLTKIAIKTLQKDILK